MADTLAARVRAKFPGAYDDLTDTQLETAVLTKHPEYADIPRSTVREDIQREAAGIRTRRASGETDGGGDVMVDHARALASWAPVLGGLLGGAPGAAAGSVVNMVAHPPQSLAGGASQFGTDVLSGALAGGAAGGLRQVGANAVEKYGAEELARMVTQKGGSALKSLLKAAGYGGGGAAWVKFEILSSDVTKEQVQ
jgi:hypothetical protein